MVFVKDNSLIIDDENFTKQDLEKALAKIKTNEGDKVKVFMSKNLALSNSKMFENLCSTIPNCEILIKLSETEYDANFNQSQVFDTEQLKTLMTNYAVASAYGANIFLSGHNWKDDERQRENKIPLSKVVIASGKINNWVDKIQNAKVDGKPLSPFEKYLYAYQLVTQFKYSDKDIFESRDISRVLTSDSIICVGYAQILSELCRRVGIPCKRQYIHEILEEEEDGILRNHMECIVKISDPKYGIEGFYIADPTIDSYDAQIDGVSTISHALMNINEYEDLYAGESEIVYDDELSKASYYFLRDNKLISDKKLIDESKAPLKMVQEKIKTPEFSKEFNTFVNKVFENTTDENDFSGVEIKNGDVSKKFETIVIFDKAYTIDEISKDEKLMTALAVRLYSISDYEPDYEMQVMEKFLQKSYLKRLKDNKKEGKDIKIDLTKNLETNEFVMYDPILLAEIGRFEDFKTIFEANSNNMMKAIGYLKCKTPQMLDYIYALRNVYKANDYSPEEANLYTNILIENSIKSAYYQGWDSLISNNPFAKAVKIKFAKEIEEDRKKLAMIDELKNDKSYT